MKRVLNRNKLRAIEALLACPTVAEAARMCGLTERTLHNYLSDKEFKAELSKHQGEVVRAGTAALVGLSSESNKVLLELLTDGTVPASVRARVALGIKQHIANALELQDIIERLEALEDASSNQKAGF